MTWFAVRALYQHEASPDHGDIFEEQISLFDAPDAMTAFSLAEKKSSEYLKLNPRFKKIGEFGAYKLGQDRDNLDGAEVWSVLLQSDLTPDEFYRRRYVDAAYAIKDGRVLEEDEEDG